MFVLEMLRLDLEELRLLLQEGRRITGDLGVISGQPGGHGRGERIALAKASSASTSGFSSSSPRTPASNPSAMTLIP